ncbi:MAG: hypothetical protein P1U32_07955 [Legionellaceae bacterium]|nr:hypothetical protein [Legionellaceae bacterium]
MGYFFHQTEAPQSNLLKEIDVFKKELNDKYLALITDTSGKRAQFDYIMQRNRAQLHLLNALHKLVLQLEQTEEGREVLKRMQGEVTLDRAYIQSLPARILIEAPDLRKKSKASQEFVGIALGVGGIPAILGTVYFLIGVLAAEAFFVTLGAICLVPAIIAAALVFALDKPRQANTFLCLENFMNEMGYGYSSARGDYVRNALYISVSDYSSNRYPNVRGLGENGLFDKPEAVKKADFACQTGAGNDVAYNPNAEKLAEAERLDIGGDMLANIEDEEAVKAAGYLKVLTPTPTL